MLKVETVKLAAGERIDVVKDEVGYSIFGPAIVVVLKEKAAADQATANAYGDSDNGVYVEGSSPNAQVIV